MKLFLYAVYVFIIPHVINTHYTHQWAVHIEGGEQVAEEVARDHGFTNHGLVSIV